MQYRMFYTTDIHIDRKHGVCFFSGNKFLVIVRIYITKEIPGRTRPLRHGVGLSFRRLSTYRADRIHPGVDRRKRGLPGSRRLIGIHIRQGQRKLILRNRYGSTVRTMNNRDRLSPVSLTGEYPVTKLVVDCLSSNAFLFDHYRGFFFQDSRLHPIPFSRIDHGSGSLCICFRHIFNFFSIFGDHLDDWNMELRCKCKVTVIVGRYTHDRSGTIISQYIVGQPDRHFRTVHRIDGIASCKDSGLLLILKTVYI